MKDLGLYGIDPKHVQKLDSVGHIKDLQRIGEKVAEQVELSHFADFLP